MSGDILKYLFCIYTMFDEHTNHDISKLTKIPVFNNVEQY